MTAAIREDKADDSGDMDAACWYVYVVRCSDDSLYTGISKDVARRIDEHNRGRGAKYTRGRRPVSLAYIETHYSKNAAMRREKRDQKTQTQR